MFDRRCLWVVSLFCLTLGLSSCSNNSGLDSIQVSPATASLVVGGATLQMTATGTFGNASHHSTENVTSETTWSSAIAGVASVSSSGVVTAVGAGTTTITGTAKGFNGPVSSSALITVTGGGGGVTVGNLVSLAIIPSVQTVSTPGETTQFIAIGTTSSGATEDLTGSAIWSSSSTQIATITRSGLAKAIGQGTSTITAIASNSNGTVVTGSATLTVTGGTAEPFTSLTVSPGAQSLSATGQTGQFIALGVTGSAGLIEDVSNSKKTVWTSTSPSIATVSTYPASPAGVVAGVSAGITTITAKLSNPDGTVLTATATVNITASAAPEPLLSIVVLPGDVTLGNLEGTAQFLAYGTFSTPPTVQDITNGIDRPDFKSAVTWISDNEEYFPVNSSGSGKETGGLATAFASGSSDIYVAATNPDGTVVYSPPATFACPYQAYVPATSTSPAVLGTCNSHTIASGLLVTLTVFNEGLNTTDWLLTAPSATGTPDVIHCGPGSKSGGSVCAATYPLGTLVTLTAPAGAGAFGGWSWNCRPIIPVTAAGPNACQVVVGDDPITASESVGAIFN